MQVLSHTSRLLAPVALPLPFSFFLRVFLAGLFSAVFAQAPCAAQPEGFPPLGDFPDARVVTREFQPNGTYVLALGTYKKVGGTWVADREQRVPGPLSRRTLELPSGFSAREGFDFYRKQFDGYRMRELFACEQRECGGSINWANNHFNVIQLYGLDQFQYYGVYEIADASSVYYASLYAVQRGNRRVYVQLDLVRAPETSQAAALAENPASFHRQLREQGYFVLPGFEVTGASDAWSVSTAEGAITALAALLRQEPEWQIALVGHDDGPSSLQVQRDQSLAYARQVRGQLVNKGVAESRIKVFGVGGLAPAGRGDRSARVEVVLIAKE